MDKENVINVLNSFDEMGMLDFVIAIVRQKFKSNSKSPFLTLKSLHFKIYG